MQTMTLYKVVWIDAYGDINEQDFSNLQSAINFTNRVQNAQVYEYKMLGEIKKINI